MSKLNQIQGELRSINQARFQELCDTYLFRLGYENINPVGSVIGMEKTATGTPDSLIVLPSGRYVFVEYTTQQKGLFKKFSYDLDKCFDESKTGIPVSKIERIILCHNSILSPAEEEGLAEKCQQHDCLLDTIGIGTLSFALYQKYPVLAKEFLGIEVDTGQVLNPTDFIRDYQSNAFATRLDIGFHFREEELEKVAATLEANDLLILTGRAGVGKSRFALECCEKFVEQHPTYQFFCIHNKGQSLYEDLKDYFAANGDYIILVDDANRLSQLDQVFRLINERLEGRRIKIVVTVRDYAVNKVKNAAAAYSSKAEIVLQPLNNKQIEEIISTEFGIKNHYYLDRISHIAKGNPRLAVMAAEVVKATNKFDSISDASALYDEYFHTIVSDLNQLENKKLLKVAGIVTFFGFLDRTQEEHFKRVSDSFNISEDEIWDSVHKLHELEVVDLYEKEVVKISDQVLSTYLFYKVFIKDELLSFATLLENYFDDYTHRFRDSVYPALDMFNTELAKSRIQKHIDRRWEAIKDDEPSLLRLATVFWFLKKTDTLLYLKERIDSLEAELIEVSSLNFEPQRYGGQDRYLDILETFQHSSTEEYKIALGLIFTYLEKRPTLLPEVMKQLDEAFCFRLDSYDHGYAVQATLISNLIENSAKRNEGDLYRKMLLRVAGKYLKTHFRSSAMSDRRTLSIQNFRLVTCPEITQLRNSLWLFLIAVHAESDYRDIVLQVILKYSTELYDNPVNEDTSQIIEEDSKVLLPFLFGTLSPSSYADCLVVQKYLTFLKLHNVAYDPNIKATFTNEIYRLSKILLHDFYDRYEEDFDGKDKKSRLDAHFEGYSYEDYVRFYASCVAISRNISAQEQYQLQYSIENVLTSLGESDAHLFKIVVGHILQTGNQLNYVYPSVVRKFKAIASDIGQIYELLNNHNYYLKQSWLFEFLMGLDVSEVSEFYLAELYKLFHSADPRQVPRHFDQLEPYMALDADVIRKVVEILFARTKKADEYFSFDLLFNPHTRISKMLGEIFGEDIGLLKDVYIYQVKIDQHLDYRGEALKNIIELDESFITDYIQWMFDQQEYGVRGRDNGHYTALWELENYETIIANALNLIYELEKSRLALIHEYTNAFFRRRGDDGSSEAASLVHQRQVSFIEIYIRQHHANPDLMRFIFDMITDCFPNMREHFLKVFLSFNKDFETFKMLSIEPRSYSWMGSAIPVLEGKIKALESLQPLFSTTALLKHKLHINEMILYWKYSIERESKKEFIDDY